MPDRIEPRPRRTTQLLGLVLVGAASLAQAQWAPFVLGKPNAPTDLSPKTGTYEGKVSGTTRLTLMWSQYFPGAGLNINPAATHFVICFDAYIGTTAPTCTVNTADWTETIAAPSGALSRSGNRFTFNPGRFIALNELDLPIRLTIGACAALANQNCRYSGVDLFYSSRNPGAAGTGGNSTLSNAATWALDIRATNVGTSPSATSPVPRFQGTVEYWEALGQGNPGRTCRVDVDAPDVRNDVTVFAFDVTGAHDRVPNLPRANGVYSGPTIVGMYREGSPYDARGFTTTSDPALPADRSSSLGVATVTFPVADASGQRTFVVVPRLDTANAIREFNENDNAVGQCKLR